MVKIEFCKLSPPLRLTLFFFFHVPINHIVTHSTTQFDYTSGLAIHLLRCHPQYFLMPAISRRRSLPKCIHSPVLVYYNINLFSSPLLNITFYSYNISQRENDIWKLDRTYIHRGVCLPPDATSNQNLTEKTTVLLNKGMATYNFTVKNIEFIACDRRKLSITLIDQIFL